MYIFYDNTPWEKQYLFQDLLPYEHELITFSKFWKPYPNIPGFKRRLKNIEDIINNNIFIFSSNKNSYENVFEIVKFIKPNVIIHLSDEWGGKNDYQYLSNYTNLLLRQYYHPNYTTFNNITYIPLGYMNNMLEKNYLELKLKPVNERKYIWSFIGNKSKTDRPIMMKEMNIITPNFIENVKDNHELAQVYRDSIFVPACLGSIGLNTMRITETLICGAIPIVVGSEKEITDTFK